MDNQIEKNYLFDDEQSDSNYISSGSVECRMVLTSKHLEYVANEAHAYWKHIAREINLNESQIVQIENNDKFLSLSQKLKFVLELWRCNQQSNTGGKIYVTLDNLFKILTACRLNKIKGKILFFFCFFFYFILFFV